VQLILPFCYSLLNFKGEDTSLRTGKTEMCLKLGNADISHPVNFIFMEKVKSFLLLSLSFSAVVQMTHVTFQGFLYFSLCQKAICTC